MATFYFSGEAKWAKVHKPDDKYNKYSIEVQLDETQLAEYNAIGLKGKAKEGGWVTFRRDPDKEVITSGGSRVPAGGPEVLDGKGNPTKELVGNGSKVTCKITTYPYDNKFGKGTGHRLEAVKINELVKFEKGGQGTLVTEGNTAAAASQLSSRPKILF